VITNDDLLKEISKEELKQLSDLNATGELNQAVIDDAISDAISFISSFITIPKNPTNLLKQITAELTIYELRKKNSLTLSNQDRLKEIESYLIKMAKKTIPKEIEKDTKDINSSFAFKKRGKKLNTKGYL
jgi:phage gp36-like protein